MRRNRRVKILATLGPSSTEQDIIEKLFVAGTDVFRINMSHAQGDLLSTLVNRIRNVEKIVNRPIGILADLQGPKLRIGEFADKSITLKEDATFVLDSNNQSGDSKRVYLPHPEILSALKSGDRLLLDDGKISLTVTNCDSSKAETIVNVGGKLSDRKGVSVPDTTIEFGALTKKDRKDLDAALHEKVDWIGLSFVQRPEDLEEVHKITQGQVGILSKIEKPQALTHLKEIIELSDSIMVARGDLGVEIPPENVPGIQKQITRACRKAGKPVVIATQMLESMINSPVPTRAEVSDVATAVFEGADAVMLSAESAAGKFPIEAVSTMNRIAETVEQDPTHPKIMYAQHTEPEATGADAISAAARQIAETMELSAIVCYTSSGATGLRAARERPKTPVIAISPVVATARRLSLAWGLHTVVSEDAENEDDMVERAAVLAFTHKFAKPNQRIIITAGVPFGTPGTTNMLRIAGINKNGTGSC